VIVGLRPTIIQQPKLGSNPTWPDLRSAFIRHYLGDSDKQVLRREIEKTCQGEREKATNFIPRFIRMVELVDPNKPEDELVDLIRSKLRHCYQDKLVLCNTYTIEELNDACLRIEASFDSGKDTNPQGKNRSKSKGEKVDKPQKSANKKQTGNSKNGSLKDNGSCIRDGKRIFRVK